MSRRWDRDAGRRPSGRGKRVVQVSGYRDPERRLPGELLDAWPSLVDVAAAAATWAEVTVVQAADEDAVLEPRGVPVRFVRERRGLPLPGRIGRWARRAPGRVVETVAVLDPDVVHVHGLGTPRLARALRKALPEAGLLVQDHADRVPPAGLRGWMRAGLAAADVVTFTAADQAAPFREAGVLPRETRVLEVLESSSWFEPGDRAAARAATGLDGDPSIIWAGHLDANKDPLTALDAVAGLAPSWPGLRLWMVYRTAPLEDAVRARVATDPRLAGRVALLGPRAHDEMEALYQAADLYLSTSRREGSGYALLEALACGTTPVVTDIPSFRRITGDGRVGRLAPVGDAGAFARRLAEVAGGDRAAMRSAVRAHFRTRLSFDAVGRQLRDAYDAARAARSTGPGAHAPTMRHGPRAPAPPST